MHGIKRSLVLVLALAALLCVGAEAAQAQTGLWPNGNYACTWRLANGVTGVSLVTITLGADTPQGRFGTARNLYVSSENTKAIRVVPDILLGGFFYEIQDGVQPYAYCHLETYNYARRLVFTNCVGSTSNPISGNLQDCRQWQ
jgi:hypothetical protein